MGENTLVVGDDGTFVDRVDDVTTDADELLLVSYREVLDGAALGTLSHPFEPSREPKRWRRSPVAMVGAHGPQAERRGPRRLPGVETAGPSTSDVAVPREAPARRWAVTHERCRPFHPASSRDRAQKPSSAGQYQGSAFT